MTTIKPAPPKQGEDCPHPEKLAWPTRRLAEQGRIQVLGSMNVHGHDGPMPVRVYPCRCGWWHMTSHPKGRK